MTGRHIIGLVVCVMLALFTGNKLRKMLAIRGWIAGARVERKFITGKDVIEDRRGPAYWIAWDNTSPAQVGEQRINLERAHWESLEIGAPIEVRYVGGDTHPYLRTGNFASNGNFVFDLLLLMAELVGAVVCAAPLFKRPPVPPPEFGFGRRAV